MRELGYTLWRNRLFPESDDRDKEEYPARYNLTAGNDNTQIHGYPESTSLAKFALVAGTRGQHKPLTSRGSSCHYTRHRVYVLLKSSSPTWTRSRSYWEEFRPLLGNVRLPTWKRLDPCLEEFKPLRGKYQVGWVQALTRKSCTSCFEEFKSLHTRTG
jgi:hypothetical protein